ncbi:hypothetical protein EKK58_04425 [Candidatus Dependentiae bacterium]|nr:MAG: hypothetical protein EKK58_04425 [Candidatus Dependentiae bacterium]
MKKSLIIVASLLFGNYVYAEIAGVITTVEQIYPGYTQNGTAFWYSGSVSYINGGVTFNFPADLFLQNPTVIVSVSAETYSSSGTLTAVVTELDTDHVTVRVNVGTMSSIGEALTDSVHVHVWAIGTQN